MRGGGVAAGVLSAVVAFSASARAAPTKRECIDANSDAQTQQNKGQLKAAKAELLTCTNDACPGAVRDDCSMRLNALAALIPSVVFEAKDANGGDLVAVAVTIDGQPLADHLDGSPFELDPGAHSFVFTTAGTPDVKKTLLLSQGDRLRHERILFAAAEAPPPTAPTPLPPVFGAPEAPASSKRKTVGIVLGAIGAGGLVAGGILGGIASSKWSAAKDACTSKTACHDRNTAVSDRSSALGLATASTIALIAGGALVIGGVVLWVTAPTTSSAQVGMVGTF